VISRALVEIFSDTVLAESLAFRGGTALHKLFLGPPSRYSEDIDLVQVRAEPIGPTFDGLRKVLSPWLGQPDRKRGPGTATLVYRFETTALPAQRLRLKIEINTREHFALLGYRKVPFSIENPWFAGAASLLTFDVHELLATKLRALYQRRKGRDLYDLDRALRSLEIDDARVVTCFQEYLHREGMSISGNAFEENLETKMTRSRFGSDVLPLIVDGHDYNPQDAAERIRTRLISRLS